MPGWDTAADELRATARRIITAKKHFNVRSGRQPAEDTLPARPSIPPPDRNTCSPADVLCQRIVWQQFWQQFPCQLE